MEMELSAASVTTTGLSVAGQNGMWSTCQEGGGGAVCGRTEWDVVKMTGGGGGCKEADLPGMDAVSVCLPSYHDGDGRLLVGWLVGQACLGRSVMLVGG